MVHKYVPSLIVEESLCVPVGGLRSTRASTREWILQYWCIISASACPHNAQITGCMYNFRALGGIVKPLNGWLDNQIDRLKSHPLEKTDMYATEKTHNLSNVYNVNSRQQNYYHVQNINEYRNTSGKDALAESAMETHTRMRARWKTHTQLTNSATLH